MTLETDQLLIIRFRTPESSAYATPKIYDKDGGTLAQGGAAGNSVKSDVKWKAAESGTYYINFTETAPGTVYLVSIQ